MSNLSPKAIPQIEAGLLWLPLWLTLEMMLQGNMPSEDEWNLVCYQARLSDKWWNDYVR